MTYLKNLKQMLLTAFVLLTAGLAMAATTQVGPNVTVSARVVDGNAHITWAGMPVAAIEHYVGHGSKGGFVKRIEVKGTTPPVLTDLAKNGGRFNFVLADGNWLHLECGGNDRTVMPRFEGLVVDCSYTDPGTGQKVGALVVK